jgi:hypothetical protein
MAIITSYHLIVPPMLFRGGCSIIHSPNNKTCPSTKPDSGTMLTDPRLDAWIAPNGPVHTPRHSPWYVTGRWQK